MQQRGDAEARDAGGRGEYQAFGKHLTNQPTPPRAKRPPHPDLAGAGRAPREQQIGDVDAGHHEDERHRARAR